MLVAREQKKRFTLDFKRLDVAYSPSSEHLLTCFLINSNGMLLNAEALLDISCPSM